MPSLPPAPPDAPRRARGLAAARAVLIVAALVALAQVVFYFCRTVDDLFISLRYAERLALGDGLTFNDGARVEGFSNPLWVFLQAALIGLGVDGLVATKLLSLASYAALLVVSYAWATRALGLTRLSAALGVLALAATSYIASWALWGLETPLYLALLVGLLLALHARLTAPSRENLAALSAVTVAFLATRPEAPLYLVALAAGALLVPPRGLSRRDVLRRALPPAAAAAAVVVALLLWRHAYYGQWLPQTYFAKQGGDFSLAKLAPLVAQGAGPLEVLYLLGALALALVMAARARATAPALVMLTTCLFVASVTVDWMPNQRHFLPLIALAPWPWLWALEHLLRRAGRQSARAVAHAVLAALVAGLLAGQAYAAFAIDARFSIYDFRSHGRGQSWVRAKSADTWRDALDGLSRTPPRHVAGMSVLGMGMIDQLFRVLEASAAPERESWFIGRDIGRVGYYSPIQIFDTAGLFTPALTASAAWRRDGTVDDAVIDAAFSHDPVATDLLDAWAHAVGARPDVMRRYDVLIGSRRDPVAMRPRAVVRPAPLVVLARYERVIEKFRAPFFTSTLYGESVGAAVEKRFAWLAPQLRANAEPLVDAPPPGLTPAAPVDLERGALTLHGCRLEPAPPPAAPGALTLACYFEAHRPVTRSLTVFVHWVDARGQLRFHGDHPPVVGLLPTTHWPVGRVVRDAVVMFFPDDLRGVELSARVGLYDGGWRAPAAPGPGVDPEGRAIGPTASP